VIAKQTGSIVNSCEVREASGQEQQASTTVVVVQPKLSIVVSGPQRRVISSAATYQITASNTGPIPITGVYVVTTLPEEIVFVSAPGGRQEGSQVRWDLGTLAPGARRTVQLVVRSRRAGELIEKATVRGDRGLSATGETRTVFEGASGLTLEIDKSDDPVEVGKTMTYTVRAINQGSAPARNLRLSVTVPAEMTVTNVQGPTNGTPDPQNRQRLIFAPVPALPAASEARYRIQVRAERPGEVRLRVELAADDLAPGAPLRADESTTIYSDQ
jgi:uncharacterized repeat protein (TIGR01451 family)